MEQKTNNKDEISIGFLWGIFKKNILLMILVAAVLGAGAGAFRMFTTKQTYSYEASFFVYGVVNTSEGISSSSSSVSTATKFATSFVNIINDGPVAEKAYDYMSENRDTLTSFDDSLTVQKISKMTHASVLGETQIIRVVVVSDNPDLARDVVKAMENVIPGVLDYFCQISEDMNGSETKDSIVKLIPREQEATPISRGTLKYAVLAAFLGAVVVYIIAFLKEFFDNTIYDDSKLKENFSNPVVGYIPDWEYGSDKKNKKKKRVQAQNKNMLLGKGTPFGVAESFKKLRTNMCYTSNDDGCLVIGVTSATAAAGKSTVAANLAISFGQIGKKTLLIDADMRLPTQYRAFGINRMQIGLSELLAGVTQEISEAIVSTEYQSLSIISSGRIPPNPSELLASERAAHLISEFKEAYDIIIIDFPPVLDVADATILSKLISKYLFVVRFGESDIRNVDTAVNILNDVEAKIAGFVLNGVDVGSNGYYYGGKYGSKYGNKQSRYGYNKIDNSVQYKSKNESQKNRDDDDDDDDDDDGDRNRKKSKRR